ncbi:hypothetical protein [Lentzea sp. NBRC 102530]|uniref:hypothetical protein n=1 Tax=Lentzea sp. NBRC 102530 TaxID=3032201 RepID=UPI002554FB21|nr:hypothetical protein [Lentzea sp. NBRC 102530]
MKLEGERWRTLVSNVRLGKDEYRVVQPVRPPKHAPLYEGYAGVESCVDKEGARTVAMAWEIAMRSPRTLVHLPLRQSDPRCSWSDGPFLDLVLMHHSLGFRLSKWKDVRARLRGGRPHTFDCRGFRPVDDYDWRYDRENRDLLRGEIVGETAFVVGSARAFNFEGLRLQDLVEDGPRQMHEDPGMHCCAEITESLWHWKWLHVVYCEEHRVHA